MTAKNPNSDNYWLAVKIFMMILRLLGRAVNKIYLK